MSGVTLSVSKMKALLSMALAERNKAIINPLHIDFAEDGAWLRQTTQDRLVAVYGVFREKFFEIYKPIGMVVMDPRNILGVIADHFRNTLTVTITKSNDKLVLDGGTAVYREPLLSPQEELLLNDVEVAVENGVRYPKPPEGFEVKAAYSFDIGYFKTVKKKWEVVTFEADGEKLKYSVQVGAGEVENTVPVKAVKPSSTKLRFKILADVLAQVAKAINGGVTMLIIANDQGEMGPVVFGQSTDLFELSYWLVAETA